MKPTLCILLAASSILHAAPLFKNSVVSNDLDFIQANDPSTAFELMALGRETKEMPDKRSDDLMQKGVFVFELKFADDVRVPIWASAAFGDASAASRYATHLGHAISKQPKALRSKLSHVILHQGDEVAFAEEGGHFFVVYSGNIDQRLATHDLEETVFHETIHATLEADHAKHPDWVAAQKKDPGFITDYAAKLPAKEDLPESALFAYTLMHHPGRLPSDVESAIRRIMPHRLAYLQSLFERMERPAN